MSRKRPGLGKGLDALIPSNIFGADVHKENNINHVSTHAIKPNPRQPRSSFNNKELKDLAKSIKEHGIIQPLIVTEGENPDEFILIAGERRLLAARDVGLDTVPIIIRKATEQDSLEIALIENIQRTDLNPLERAEAYRQLKEEFGLAHDEIGRKVGKSRVSVTNTLRLLNLPQNVLNALLSNSISEGHARALLQLPTSQSQVGALKTILDHKLNVRQTEELVRKLTGDKPRPKKKLKTSPEITAIEEKIRRKLGTKVTINHGKQRGRITIHYYSEEELNSLLDILTKN